MSLISRLNQLELVGIRVNAIREPRFDFDEFVSRLGLKPAEIRESALSNGSSLMEAVCNVLGVDVKDFKSQLKESAKLLR